MGDSIYCIRRALYELRYKEGKTDGSTEVEILNYAKARGWPMPVRNFDAAVGRLRSLGRATDTGAGDVLTRRYRLTPEGELDDEERRRPWRERLVDELTSPATVAKVLIGTIGAVLGIVAGIVATLLAQRMLPTT